MAKEVKKSTVKQPVFDAKRRESILELYRKQGIPARDSTQESIGQTTIFFSPLPNREQSDEAETCLRNLNRRKNS
jgi:hypothetical protein